VPPRPLSNESQLASVCGRHFTLHKIFASTEHPAHGTLDVKFLSKKGGTLFYLRNLVSKVPPLLSNESKQSVYNNKIPVVRYTR
jgi:hypothetical protein